MSKIGKLLGIGVLAAAVLVPAAAQAQWAGGYPPPYGAPPPYGYSYLPPNYGYGYPPPAYGYGPPPPYGPYGYYGRPYGDRYYRGYRDPWDRRWNDWFPFNNRRWNDFSPFSGRRGNNWFPIW